jgi:hypothetical protein
MIVSTHADLYNPDLDLLFYAANLTEDPALAHMAQTHASTLLRSHIRGDMSTFHVANFDQNTGRIKTRFTNQSFSDDSCWARGQAWGIAGYAQTFGWTQERKFLDASMRLAVYFIEHLPEDQVPFWDFDAPSPAPRDTSAALVAVYGMLLHHRHTHAKSSRNLEASLKILESMVDMSFTSDLTVSETLILNATINNYEFAPKRFADHGLVYADYYFLLIGNTLLEMDMI